VLLNFLRKPGLASRHKAIMIDSRQSSGMLSPAEEELPALPIWAFTLGVFGLLTFGLTAVPSIICGHLALTRTRNSKKGSLAKSVALVGLVIGYVGVVILGMWTVAMARYVAS
jgi:hypothetical protein